MFQLLFGGTIYSRVMQVLKARIRDAQARHEAHCKRLDDEHEQTVSRLEEQRDSAKDAHADEMVHGIIGRI